jgi:hypothetical protein
MYLKVLVARVSARKQNESTASSKPMHGGATIAEILRARMTRRLEVQTPRSADSGRILLHRPSKNRLPGRGKPK